MNEQQAREDIKLIKDMLQRTRRSTAESGTLYIFWGVLIILGIAGMYILAFARKDNLIWYNWALFGLIGWIYSAVYGIRRDRKQKTKTYIQTAADYLSFGCAIAYVLVAFAFPLLKLYSYEMIPIMMALVTGILLFARGGLYEWPLLIWAGVLWWAGAVGMAFVPGDYRALCLVPLMIIGFIVPGLLFQARFRGERVEPAGS